ncbi:MAG TPA: dihydrolipoyllysine-residue acetyltransferase [Hyphomicrobiales bacterium]|nr:dihydrolipoyllysine-residue acetyltransferase [Hyphomicrobiales bacterium]
MAVEKILVPDLGTDDAVEVIEILVKAGDTIGENDSLVVLESDKAAMEIPATKGGVVKEVLVKEGSQVKTGSDLLMLEIAGDAAAKKDASPAKEAPAAKKAEPSAAKATAAPEPAPKQTASVQPIAVPDLGGAENVDVIDILVKVGDVVNEEDGLITLETDKASMEVPAPVAGKIVAVKVKVGDKVSQGSVIVDIESSAPIATKAAEPEPAPEAAKPAAAPAAKESAPAAASNAPVASNSDVYAGPAVRKLARELGVDLGRVSGTGLKHRIVKEDLHNFVKSVMKGGGAAGAGVPAVEDIDFSRFGPVEEVEMSKLHRVTAQNMIKCWLNVPHVTQFDEADITDLESFRSAQKALAEKKGIKLTPLPFIVKASAQALVAHPQFNVSLHSSGTKLIQKKYVNIGVAVATPAGLMVPVVKNADKKSIWQIASEVAALGAKAKDRKLTKEDMEGACFTISSLGNIGGTGFTPIVNTPEVAILGVSRAAVKPVWNGKEFAPRTLLPYSLSYDHRAVNGADAGAFCTYLGQLLSDIRLMVL